MSPALTMERLRELLRYRADNGDFIWRKGRTGTAKVGTIAGNITRRRNGRSYRSIMIDNKQYYAHRLAFFYMTERWPITVDHRDRNGLNNSWINLRAATHRQNNANRNICGVRKYLDKWRSRITIDGVRVSLGVFKTPDEAHQAYVEAARRVHGEFAYQ